MSASTTNAAESILEWWHVLVYAGTMFVGFILGTAKQRWTQDQLQVKVSALEARLHALEQAANLDSRAVLVMQNELSHIRAALVDIKAKLEA